MAIVSGSCGNKDNMDLVSAFRKKNVFITGHTGFKGSWLSLWLSKLGADVFGYSLKLESTPNNYTVSNVSDLIFEETIADIRDKKSLKEAIRRADPDFIFHLAAQPLVRESYDFPVETFETNVIGSLNVLESLRKLERSCSVIMVTSDKCYENNGQLWGYRENDPLGGHDPYSASKAAAEIAVSSYRQSFFQKELLNKHRVKVATVRAGNVIGGGDWAKDRIIPDAVRAWSKGKTVLVRNPNAVRPWQHVLEPLYGYLVLAAEMSESENPEFCSAWNFGPFCSDECAVSDMMDLFCKEWGCANWNHISQSDAPYEASVLRLSIDKAIYKLNWSPRWDLRQTVKKTVAWYKEYYNNDKRSMQDACFADIDAYMGGKDED
jgi:CDP-glucose 4,6-dehydratase